MFITIRDIYTLNSDHRKIVNQDRTKTNIQNIDYTPARRLKNDKTSGSEFFKIKRDFQSIREPHDFCKPPCTTLYLHNFRFGLDELLWISFGVRNGAQFDSCSSSQILCT